jgi:hypothetical protein
MYKCAAANSLGMKFSLTLLSNDLVNVMPAQLFKMLIELFNKRMDFLLLVGKSELS